MFFGEARGRRGDGLAGRSMLCGGHDFAQGYHHEIPLLHTGMRQGEYGGGKVQVAIHEQVYVDGAIVVYAVLRLRLSPQLTLYLLCPLEALLGRECGADQAGGVEKRVFAMKTPGVGLDERRDTLHRADALLYQRNGTVQHLLPVAQVRTQRKV